NVKTAEEVYKDGILKAAGIVENKPLNDLEKIILIRPEQEQKQEMQKKLKRLRAAELSD
ncbi:11235_t:CDS:1, partial [Gigaspora margarita]